MRNSTFQDQVLPERQSLYLSTESLVVEHGRDAARPMFSAPPTLCFHKSRPGREFRREWAGAPAPTVTLHAPVSATLPLILVLSSPASSGLFLLSASRLRPFSFKCFFMWFRRFLSTFISFSLPFRPTASPPVPFPTPARAFTFRLPGRNYCVLRFASGFVGETYRWSLVETVLGNIRGTTRDSATLSSLPQPWLIPRNRFAKICDNRLSPAVQSFLRSVLCGFWSLRSAEIKHEIKVRTIKRIPNFRKFYIHKSRKYMYY